MNKKAIKALTILGGALCLILLILYTGGFFTTGKIAPGKTAAELPHPKSVYQDLKAEIQSWPDIYEAVGTVRPTTEAQVEAQVRGRILKVQVRTGDRVKEGQLLASLADQEYRARVGQARHQLDSARAAQSLSATEYGRLQRLAKVGAAPKSELDRAKEADQRARAATLRAEESLEEAKIALGYTMIKAPDAGQIVKRLVDPGDLALPGRPLFILQTGAAMQLEALVREGLINMVKLGQELLVSIPAMQKTMPGKIVEIAPAADPQTRAFLVKVHIPGDQGVYSGMFGRLLIPVGKSRVIVVPGSAVFRVGQLEMVLVKTKEGYERTHVTTGRQRKGMVEILSGLSGKETLGQGPDHE
ncbi:efflux RND transporter periplasmic adaptor subunit [Dethiosulfatarculus sandiegensis]|uniref:efflux RND transporter periplasmic adaptor subunit n=1 Tax=Dethiosulfatarculus sandiegensis TaxID=1429043 RepID=UPI0005CB2180|nr:efflux RND transporter periplasmic adaptor subunit [Dethiosulfatarculus sandiegensis]